MDIFSFRNNQLPIGTMTNAKAMQGYAFDNSIFCNTQIQAIVVTPYKANAESKIGRVSYEKKLPELAKDLALSLNNICPAAIPITHKIAIK